MACEFQELEFKMDLPYYLLFFFSFDCLQGGIYVLQIIDWYCASFSLMLISFTECMAISWVYGKYV